MENRGRFPTTADNRRWICMHKRIYPTARHSISIRVRAGVRGRCETSSTEHVCEFRLTQVAKSLEAQCQLFSLFLHTSIHMQGTCQKSEPTHRCARIDIATRSPIM